MIAIIPARGGSKRIPGKNIKPFLGYPVIEYSIRTAKASGCFDEVLVSTDSEEIAAVSRRAGAWVPFLRSEESSNDFATTADVVREVLDRLSREGFSYDSFAVIYATAPFITTDTLRTGAELLEQGHKAAFTCVEYSYPIQRALVIHDDRVTMAQPQYLQSRSQDLEKHYHDAGQCYFSTVEAFEACGSLWGPDTAPIILSDLEVQDIDTPVDWQLAELKYQLLHPEGPQFEEEKREGLAALKLKLGPFKLVPYQELSAAVSEQMRMGRNLPEIREWMVNREKISAEDHARFVLNLEGDTRRGYYALFCSFGNNLEPELIGCITLHDMGEGNVERGIWLFPDNWANGYSRAVLQRLYKALGEAGYRHIYTRVRHDNQASIALDKSLRAHSIGADSLPETMGPADNEMVYFRYDV